MVYIISIEGNIGSGKSTVVNYLKEYYKNNNDVVFLLEPVNIWSSITDENGKSILENFYENKEKYAFSFQIIAYISRLRIMNEAIKNNPYSIIITERSLFTDRYVFAQMLYDDNKISEIDMKIYTYWFDYFVYNIDRTIYLDANPEKCIERILKRGRSGEENITLDYIKTCDEYHKKMLMYNTDFMTTIIDTNTDYDDSVIPEYINSVKEIINTKLNAGHGAIGHMFSKGVFNYKSMEYIQR